MKFTDKFIKIPVVLYNTKQAELVGYNNDTASDISFMMIDPNEIAYYRPSQTDEENEGDFDNVLISFKNGLSWHANLCIEEFEKLLNEFS